MLDLRLIREDPEAVRAALARRRAADGALEEVLTLDKRWLELRPQIDELRATQNKASEKIAEAKRAGGVVRHRFPAGHRAADLPPARGRPLPGGHVRGRARLAARRRDPRRGRAAEALRRLLDVLPPRGGRGRQGHARDIPRAPVRQGG